MTARPTDDPTWATDATYAVDAGPDEGLANKVAASAGKREQGLRRGEPALAPEDNFWRNLVGKFIEYFDTPGVDNTTTYPLAARTVTRFMRNPFVSYERAGVADWDNYKDTSVLQVNTTDVDATVTCVLDLPNACELNGVIWYVTGNTGHGVFPISGFVKPVLEVVKFNPVNGNETVLGAVSDPSGTATAYQTAHFIWVTGLTETIDNANFTYFARLTGEHGSGTVASLRAHGVWTQLFVSSVDPGA